MAPVKYSAQVMTQVSLFSDRSFVLIIITWLARYINTLNPWVIRGLAKNHQRKADSIAIPKSHLCRVVQPSALNLKARIVINPEPIK
jgi:hypothetical protein